MLLEPRYLLQEPGLVAATVAVIMVGKPLAAVGIVLLLRYPLKTALRVAAALAQIGEFSFILAALAARLGLLPAGAPHALVAAAIVSITLNPILYRLVGPVEAWASRRPRLRRLVRPGPDHAAPDAAAPMEGARRVDPRHRAVLIGYGPTGRTLTRLLRENGIEPTVIDLNLDVVRALRAEGTLAVYGDAGQRETLRQAGVDRAANLILGAARMEGGEAVIRLAREMNPSLRILARSTYLRDVSALRRAGADTVFPGEGEVALALTAAILGELGATPEQIDRERERVHEELSGAAPEAAGTGRG
jgi:CPA2 family monovalent cation:H+ antiporter-2